MTRDEATAAILAAKRAKGLTWSDIAAAAGRSKEWTTAACLGQMKLSAAQAEAVGKLLELDGETVAAVQVVPYRGSLPTAVPTDPLVYRFYELIQVYGTTFKELISEEFGDGIMSAIDFRMSLEREPDPAGDRVNITMSGKFLPYKEY
jgi:cyanate lyase